MPVIVYSKDSCPQCTATLKSLAKLGIEADVRNTSHDEAAREEALNTGHLSAPILVWKDGSSWFGFRPDMIRAKATELAQV